MVVAVGAAVLLAGCDSTSSNSGPTPSNSQPAVTTTAAAAITSAGGATASAGGENSNTGVESATAAPAPAQQPVTAAPVALWDPCGISEADITEQGFRPDSREVLTDDSGDKSCRWQSLTGNSEFTIVSTRQTLQDLLQSGRYVDFDPLPVGDRAAYRYRAAQDTNKIGCYIGIPVPGGLVAFVTRNPKPDAPQEPCVAARRLSGALVGYLP
ncbi:DUF3558 family protein [Nocardia sp. CY41]|uniref:DUF3558 family protein n=1 Tax=Nocardia sp. CY41 TaxID=2608686 RepID=UPI001F2C9F16|nr:DUF3558 family protein [Nocardia sp. CY41]